MLSFHIMLVYGGFVSIARFAKSWMLGVQGTICVNVQIQKKFWFIQTYWCRIVHIGVCLSNTGCVRAAPVFVAQLCCHCGILLRGVCGIFAIQVFWCFCYEP